MTVDVGVGSTPDVGLPSTVTCRGAPPNRGRWLAMLTELIPGKLVRRRPSA
jgi:hypothetical protein